MSEEANEMERDGERWREMERDGERWSDSSESGADGRVGGL